MKKPLKVALHKCERISATELYGYFTPVEFLLLIDYFGIKEHPYLEYYKEQKEKGVGYSSCKYLKVTREQAEAFPLNRYYR